MNIKEKVKRYYRYAFKDVPKARLDNKYPMERHGSTYGGWNIIQNSLNSSSTVYSFGIGKDISFDRSINDKYRCTVHGFDPTPEVKNWLEQFQDLQFFKYHPIALGVKDGRENFYFPNNENNISMTTLKNELGSSKSIEVEIARLTTLMKKLNHNSVDLLKMDIEGSEYEVIPDILNQNLDIDQILIEMHHFFDSFSGQDSDDLIQKMRSKNYELISISDSICEFSFKKVK